MEGTQPQVHESSIYDPPFINRVDVLPADMRARGGGPGAGAGVGRMDRRSQTPAGELLESGIAGKTMNWEVLYTYNGA